MRVYLDWAATAPRDTDILDEYARLSAEYWANPSSRHAEGRKSREFLEDARRRCAQILKVQSNQLYFTSGGTESNHLPILSLLTRPTHGSIATSILEHPSIIEQLKAMEATGWHTRVIPSTEEGHITSDAVCASLAEDTALVLVQAVNNETGAIQDTASIARELMINRNGKRKPHFHVDAVQAIGKIDFFCNEPGIDSASLSAHKIGGLPGSGLLYIAKKTEAFLRGGGQEGGLRSGTEDVAAAGALALALEKAQKGPEKIRSISSVLYSILTDIPNLHFVPSTREHLDPRFSPAIYQCAIDGIPGEVAVRMLDEAGCAVSTGSACSSRKNKRPVLEAMRINPETRQNAFRISIGETTSHEQLFFFGKVLKEISRSN